MSNEGLGLLPAPLGRRSSAFLIDALFVGIVAIPGIVSYPVVVGALLAGDTPPLLSIVLSVVGYALTLILVLVQLIVHGLRGVTIGKRMLGLRSVNVDTLGKPGFWRVALRAVVLVAAGTVVPVLGALVLLASPLWAGNRADRGWLDLISRSWLLDVRAGLNPYDAKALRLARRDLERAGQPVEADVPSLATGGEGRVGFVPGSRSRSSIVVGSAAGVAADAAPLAAPAPAQPAPAISDSPPAAAAVAQPVVQGAPVASAPPAASVPPVASAPVASAPAASPAPTASMAARALLVDHDSIRYTVDGTALIGRNPTAHPAHPGLAVIAVADDSFSMSKTHARLDVVDGGIRLTDLGSSNGSAAIDRAGVAAPVADGDSTIIPWGGTMRLGDRAFAVYPPSSEARPGSEARGDA